VFWEKLDIVGNLVRTYYFIPDYAIEILRGEGNGHGEL
jgi:hypothetical protein